MAEGRILSRRISRSHKLAALSSDTARMIYSWLIPYLDVEGRMDKVRINSGIREVEEKRSIREAEGGMGETKPPLKEEPITPIPKSRYHQKQTTEAEKRKLQELIQQVSSLYPYDRYKFNPLLWIQNHISAHPQAIRTAFQRLVEANEKQEKIVNIKAYADTVVEEETKTMNADDYEQETAEKKGPVTQQGMATIGQIMAGIGRASP
jgi:hypothetical protein